MLNILFSVYEKFKIRWAINIALWRSNKVHKWKLQVHPKRKRKLGSLEGRRRGGKETSCSVKLGEFPEQLGIYQLFYLDRQIDCLLVHFVQCHSISVTVRYRTVQFSVKTVPDGNYLLVQSNTAVRLCKQLVQLLCAVSQFICHSKVPYSTVQCEDCARW